MAQKLKNILDNTSQEEFERDWAAIEDLGLNGPHAVEVVEYFTFSQATTISYELQVNDQNTFLLSNNSFYTAA